MRATPTHIKPSSAIDLTGRRFGMLTVLRSAGKDRGGNWFYSCVCDCGMFNVVKAGHLQGGKTVSCGCFRRQQSSERASRRMYKQAVPQARPARVADGLSERAALDHEAVPLDAIGGPYAVHP